MGGLLNLPDGWTGDAHNLYLELLAETGLIGFALFGFLIVLALRAALRQLRRTENHFSKMIARRFLCRYLWCAGPRNG